MFNWLTIELLNRCNKCCAFCGRAKIRDKMELGDMEMPLFEHIIKQYKGDILQFSRDGEPLLYNDIGLIGRLTRSYFTNIVTNGILLYEKRHELSNRFDTITVSVIEDDPVQFDNVKRFVEWNKDKLPRVYIKFLGVYDNPDYKKLGLPTMRRTLHNPQGDWDYQSKEQLIPEIGVCLDFMMKPSINWKGEMFVCNRFDPKKFGLIGDVKKETLTRIWKVNRLNWFEKHRHGNRAEVPLCKQCEFWGIPRYI
jgi:radical SAM protein with 4Fe4S-binding SPASM domain